MSCFTSINTIISGLLPTMGRAVITLTWVAIARMPIPAGRI
jgi:hypothetical protein